MKHKTKLLLIAAFFVLAIPMIFTGNASAKYIGDGAVQNGVTGGWDLPADRGVCITGIKSDGTMIIDSSITSRPDCLAKVFPAYTTSATCKTSDSAGANVEGAHYWASTCIKNSDGTAISLKNLDRNKNMCEQKGAAGVYSWKQACTSTWTNLGPSLAGTDGFCYTRVTLDAYTDATCPITTFGYSVVDYGTCSDTSKTTEATCVAAGATWTANKKCTYAYGIVGVAAAKLTNMAGATYASAGATVDLTGLSMGQCLYNGASFSNHTTKGGTADVDTTTPDTSTIATPITGVRAGCLSCHNNTSQYNSYAGRWKSDYLKTGHRNMLRKVTAGKNWAGPDADGVMEIYTSAASGQTLDFVNAEATGSYGTKPLMYIFGDWMAPAPDGLDTIVWDTTTAKYNGGNSYSCAPCHTTGWRNEDTTKGVCSLSSYTTQATCEGASAIWYPSSGAQGYLIGGAEPAASWPAYKTGNTVPGIAGQWDVDGIVCSRCHMVTYDPTLPLNENGVNAAPGHTTHETEIFEGEIIVNICYGCHQSPAKTSTGTGAGNGADADLAHPEYIPVKDSDSTSAYKPMFSGHVLGNSFLNSPHGKFTGTIVPNPLGKYDIATGTYASTFKGKVCRNSTTAGSGSVLETTATGGIISSLADCNRANGKPVGDTADYGYWQDEAGAGNCTTCHNVHESLFDASATEPLRRECLTCHSTGGQVPATAISISQINHPAGVGTPLENAATHPNSACEICHMPKPTSGDFPMHVWRINADPTYSTFPTQAEFEDATNAKKIANMAAAGTYTNAVWVDVDLACGQCHGGGADFNSKKYPVAAGAYYIPKSVLAAHAATIHGSGNANPPYPDTPPAAPVAAGTITDNEGVTTDQTGKTGTIFTLDTTGSSADTINGTAPVAYINWGDGSAMATGAVGGSFTKTYSSNGNYKVTLVVKDSLGYNDSESWTITVSNATNGAATGTCAVTTSPAMAKVNVYLKQVVGANTLTKASGATSAAGTLTLPTMGTLNTGTYKMYVYGPNGAKCYTDALHTTQFANGSDVTVAGSITLYCQ